MKKVFRYILLLPLITHAEVSVSADLFDPFAGRSLVADLKASSVGDTLTVLVVESAIAETSARTRTDKDADFSIGLFDSTSSHDAGLQVGGGTDGDAVTRRAGKIQAQLSARVVSVDANGNLIIEGHQRITVNGEEQSILIKGGIRKSDISRKNTVLSSRLVNVEIQYTGDGIVNEAQKKGIIAAALSWLGLF